MKQLTPLLACIALALCPTIFAASTITHNQITWTFDKDYETGQYVNGDYWVKGPVNIIKISNDWHNHGFTPKKGQDGSMINPGTSEKQGYDYRLKNYDPKLNVSYPNGKAISLDNPLTIKINSTLISTISWLANSDTDKEPGCPKYNGGTKAPRPVLRNASILTIVSEIPLKNSFRPGYCSKDKSSTFTTEHIQWDRLPNLTPVKNINKLNKLERKVERPWIDHVHQYLGAMTHPTQNMPEYGRNLSTLIGEVALMLLLDFDQLPGKPKKDKLLIGLLQIGIDFASIADNGGSWPSNGGHHMGRKFPILFAGHILNDKHMSNVGNWKTGFHEDLDTFYVSQAEIDICNGTEWKPDKRAKAKKYSKKDIGLPEWGIRHVVDPWADNFDWSATYRDINNQSYPGWILATHILGLKKKWNHSALFDYIDRSTTHGSNGNPPNSSRYVTYAFGNQFIFNMWQAYRDAYGCKWTPISTDVYSQGKLSCDKCQYHCPNKAAKE